MAAVKVCGLRHKTNIAEIVELQPDFIGFVFFKGSPRDASVTLSKEGLPDIPPEVRRVGVFVNAALEEVEAAVAKFGLAAAQLHGDESPESCARLRDRLSGLTIIKAIPIVDPSSFSTLERYSQAVDYFLFETASPNYGGSGKKFDWALLDRLESTRPFLLTGGIGPDDCETVKKILSTHKECIGCDINSRFEIAPGLKDIAAIRKFLREMRTE